MRTEPLPRSDAPLARLEVDHHAVSVPEGTTVLQAAEAAGVYVPSLCSHREMSPFGGCRLCTVEIAGMRGYPLACSTLVTDGMEVTTDTVALREMRREILRLILSQHPASCLLCDEKDECARGQTTIRKAGVSTGCRSCPNDGLCELQEVVERVGIGELGYPVAYRGLEVEHDDPFYDRDYNLCILCGRCVRMCDEVRGTSVLAFTQRGPRTLIAPAFGSSHVEAGCEFCGACVSVCPTGALADKVSKWDGAPDGFETSTCPLCSLGCRVEIAHRDGRLSWARGAHDVEINDGQLCVRGRFCLPEATHHHSRARKPMLRRGVYFRVVDWDEALEAVAEKLDGVKAGELLMVVSSDLSNEGLYAAQRLVRSGLGSTGVDSTARAYLPGGPALWSRLFALPVSIEALAEADAVIAAGFDSRFSFSVVGVQARRAVRRGATLVAVDARESNLAQAADDWLRPSPGGEAQALTQLVRRLRDGGEPRGVQPSPVAEERLAAVALRLKSARTLAVAIGPRVFDCPGAEALVAELETLAARKGTTVLPLVHGANTRGALELGALRGVLPGPRPAAARGLDLDQVRAGRGARVLYLVGEAPFVERPECDFIIAQDLYLPPFPVDAFLPAASFAEADGTLTNIEGRVQEVRRIEDVDADAVQSHARPDWRVFSDLALRLGLPGLEYPNAAAVRAAIRAEVPGFPVEQDRSRRRMSPMTTKSRRAPHRAGGVGGKGRFVLVSEQASFRHRGIDLAAVVEGLGELHLEEGLRMNPDDMARLGVEPGEPVTVSAEGVEAVLAARADPDCPRGAAYVASPQTWGGRGGDAAPPALGQLSRLPAGPLRVRISAGDRSHPSQRSRPPSSSRAGAGGGSHRTRAPGAATSEGASAGEPGGGHGRGR
jgi:formate dehydrogenase alpha subunit